MTEVNAKMICSQGVGRDSRRFPMRQDQIMAIRLGFYPNLGKMNLLVGRVQFDKTTPEIKTSSPTFSARSFLR
jgi:hypothetical protein